MDSTVNQEALQSLFIDYTPQYMVTTERPNTQNVIFEVDMNRPCTSGTSDGIEEVLDVLDSEDPDDVLLKKARGKSREYTKAMMDARIQIKHANQEKRDMEFTHQRAELIRLKESAKQNILALKKENQELINQINASEKQLKEDFNENISLCEIGEKKLSLILKNFPDDVGNHIHEEKLNLLAFCNSCIQKK